MLIEKIDDLADRNKILEYKLLSSKASIEPLHMQDTATTIMHSICFSGDVYAQLNQFEHSIDMELEDFQQLEFSYRVSVLG